MNKNLKQAALWLGPLLFGLILLFFKPTGLSAAGIAVLACTVWVAIWWIFEVTDIAVTALLPIVLFPLTGALGLGSTTASYGHKYIFLYMGGFMLALAIERWNLHRRIALQIIKWIGSSVPMIILGFMIATAFMSMWISNTATSVMMLPIGLAIVAQLKDDPRTREDENAEFGKALMLSIAYSASIGGIATLIGTPPNLVLAGVLETLYDVELGFGQWFMYGLPISIILLFFCWWYLTHVAYRFDTGNFKQGKSEIEEQLRKLGRLSNEERTVGILFFVTACLWIGRSFLQKWIPMLDDTIIAIGAGICLFLLPSKSENRPLLTWSEAVKLPWGIIILFGGGMALASGFQESGLAEWFGMQFGSIAGWPLFLIVLVIAVAVNFFTEITSNLATTAMLLPILAPLAQTMGIHPYVVMIAATTAASCAFMLPVATPPNAVVFGSGYLTIPDMVKAGFWINVVSIIVITLFVYFVLPELWGFDKNVFPVEWIR